jgi:formylglycine-generating enzyme required for sulfatase activity
VSWLVIVPGGLLVIGLLAGVSLGPSAGGGASADDMIRIPAGTFQMGSADGDAEKKLLHDLGVKSFQIDRTEVTAGAYAACSIGAYET